MPVDWSKYPTNWKEIASRIKDEAGWKCEKCGKQCRFPGEEFDTHKRTLTVAHINHVEADCRDENLVALCPACHLKYDGYRKAMQRLAKKRIDAISGQPLLTIRAESKEFELSDLMAPYGGKTRDEIPDDVLDQMDTLIGDIKRERQST